MDIEGPATQTLTPGVPGPEGDALLSVERYLLAGEAAADQDAVSIIAKARDALIDAVVDEIDADRRALAALERAAVGVLCVPDEGGGLIGCGGEGFRNMLAGHVDAQINPLEARRNRRTTQQNRRRLRGDPSRHPVARIAQPEGRPGDGQLPRRGFGPGSR